MARLHVMERSHAQAVMDDLHDALGRRLAVSSLAPCPVEFTAALVNLCSTQSCGKCTPCRVGTQRSYEIMDRISKGQGKLEDLDTLQNLIAEMERASNCGLGQTATVPIRDMLKHFRTEVEAHIQLGSCPNGVCEMNLVTEHIG